VTPLSSDRPLQQVSVEDIGAFTLMALSEPGQWTGRSVDLAGDELSMAEAAQVVTRVTQRPVAVRQVAWDDFREHGEDGVNVFPTMVPRPPARRPGTGCARSSPQMVTLENYLRRHRGGRDRTLCRRSIPLGKRFALWSAS
jgi:hypothetical protein